MEICDYVDISEDLDTVRYLSYFFNPEIMKLSKECVCVCVWYVHVCSVCACIACVCSV